MNPDEMASRDFECKKIYLNSASSSLNPEQSLRAMEYFARRYSVIGTDSPDSDGFLRDLLRQTRTAVSEVLGCRPEEVVLTQSTTDGINMVANGIGLDPDSNIVIRGMAHEHHSNYYPWLRLGSKTAIRHLSIDINGFFEMDDLEAAVDEETRLVSLSHALYNTGAILPIEETGKILGEKGVPFLVDAAQTVGCIGEFDVGRLHCDFMSFTGSKWLCGPMGTGIFYCRRNSAELLEPSQIGGESAMLYDETKLAHRDIPERFQAGFRNYLGMAGLEASVRYLQRLGMQSIRKRVISLADQLRYELSRIPGVILYGPEDSSLRTSIVSFNLYKRDPAEIVRILDSKGIVLAVREILDEKIIRASPHFFNTEEEIQTVANAIRTL